MAPTRNTAADSGLTMEWKSLDGAAFEIKDAERGTFEAVVATLGVVDHDGDIIRHGAVKDGAKVIVSTYGHSSVLVGTRPAGKGTLHVVGDRVIAKGRLFLSTFEGKETHALLHEMGGDQEWSFGFHPSGTDYPTENERKAGAERILTELSAFEVSPVLLGAGIGTGTLGVKRAAVLEPPAAQADGDPALGTAPAPDPGPEPVPVPDRVPDDAPVLKAEPGLAALVAASTAYASELARAEPEAKDALRLLADGTALDLKILPTPSGGESESTFVSRCMANETMQAEFADEEQRAAVCYRQYNEGKSAVAGVAPPSALLVEPPAAVRDDPLVKEFMRFQRTMKHYGETA